MDDNVVDLPGYVVDLPRKHYGRLRGSFDEDVILDVLPKRNLRNLVKDSSVPSCSSSVPSSYKYISIDVWMHISEHVKPEDVRTFALICRQTAAIVQTRAFWKNLFKRYCKQVSHGNLTVPDYLKNKTLRTCHTQTLRCHVIQTLFHCYAPLLNRIKAGYTLEDLVGRSYVSSWHKQCQCIWMMCYKFWNNVKIPKASSPMPTVDNWESLADNDISMECNEVNPFEGVFLLVISCNSYFPLPNHLLYDTLNGERHTRLIATRQLLTKDIQSFNLELDFQDPLKHSVTTVTHPSILKYKVLPWWHPDFKIFIK